MIKKVLIISHNEVCYNPRLLKAADFFYNKGLHVDVYNPIVGIASEEVYQDSLKDRKWTIIENDISKRNLSSYIKWAVSSVLHLFVQFSVDVLKLEIWSKYYLNKGLFFFPKLKQDYDYILVHLIDNLPYAVKLAKKMGAAVIYDSQEYFVGQYQAFEQNKFEWVKKNQEKYIYEIALLITTTLAMKKQLLEDYELAVPAVVVRNVPVSPIEIDKSSVLANTKLKLVWHGMGIYFENRRGLHIVLKAIAKCKADVELYLQGKFPEAQKAILEKYKSEYNLSEKVFILPPARPDFIVESLVTYDIGVTPELPLERNQELTSSNKLFDYIHAGLAVISSDVLGLRETIDEFKVGLLFKPGSEVQLAAQIDSLASNDQLVAELKENSLRAREHLTWAKEYEQVLANM